MKLLMLVTLFLFPFLVLGSDSDTNQIGVQIIRRTQPTECPEGARVREGKWILVHFTAVVDQSSKAGTAGSVRQNSRQVGLPIAVQMVKGEVISGWLIGLNAACEGSTVELVLSPEHSYGEDTTLRFEIDILKVSTEKIEEPSLFDQIDANDDGQLSIQEFQNYFTTFRKDELDKNGQPPLGLFVKDDINQNANLNWEEFSGPKGTTPPTKAKERLMKEKNDPELSKKRKGDPYKFVINADFGGKPEEAKKDQL